MIDYIRTFTGKKLHIEPKPEDIDIRDIAHSLSLAPRWGGHSTFPYTVAAHSIYVSRIVPVGFHLFALLHDASEAYLADIPSPMKVLLPDYKLLEHKIMVAVATRFGFHWPNGEIHHLHPVKLADLDALYLERQNLFTIPNDGDIVAMRTPASLVKEEGPEKWNFQRWSKMPQDVLEHTFLDFFHAYENETQTEWTPPIPKT